MERNQIALSLENERLAAVAAVVRDSRVVVKSWLLAQRPAGLDLNDGAAVGKWIASELRAAGMWSVAKRGAVIFGVPRGEVAMKRIAFPPGFSDADLPGMVNLQIVRQLTVSPENAAIDYVPIASTPSRTAPATPAGTSAGITVLAGALQGDRLQWRRAICRSAGLTLRRVGLQSMGAAALLSESSLRRGGGTLGISLGFGSTEFVIVEDGQLLFARATDLVRPGVDGDGDAFAQKVAVEAKRTWMSHRAGPEAAAVDGIVVLGADSLAERVAARCTETLEMSAVTAGFPAIVEAPAVMTEADRAAMAPLVGLLAEQAMGRQRLDFAHPRRAPDLGEARRRVVLLGALGLILVGGGGYTMANVDLNARARRLEMLKVDWKKGDEEYRAFILAKARAEHIQEWRSARVDWASHVRHLIEQMPDPGDAVLDSLAARGEGDALYTAKKDQKAYETSGWTQNVEAVLTLNGAMKRRETADILRAKLVADDRYSLTTRGADIANRFDWSLTSQLPTLAPPAPTPAPPPAPAKTPAATKAAPATGAPK